MKVYIYARDASMCMTENVSLWSAAIEIVAFNASKGRVPASRSGRSSLLNPLATIRDLICTGPPSYALSVSNIHVSTGLTWYCATASRSSTFSHTQKSRKYFNTCSRALRTSCEGNSLPVTSSMHITYCYYSSISANNACFSRLRLAKPFMIDLHNFSSF